METIEASSTGQYLFSPKDLRTETRNVPAPEADHVQIAMRATTLCGSDMHYYQHARNGSIEVCEPLCLGHEAAGEVVAVGTDVDLRVGDRVAVECGIPCDDCDWCRAGRYNLCPKLRFRGSGSVRPHFQGTLQTRINHPAKWCHKLPDNVSFEEGALLEPLSVAIHACRRASIVTGSSCTIIGAGAIGLLCAVAARRAGCTTIGIADIVESRVAFAMEHGFADVGYVVEPKSAAGVSEKVEAARNTAKAINALRLANGGELGRTDCTFECTGVEACIQTAIYTTKTGGGVILVGMGTPNVLLPVSEASAREINLIPTWRYAGCYPEALQLMKASRESSTTPTLASLITHRFDGIDSIPEALRLACLSKDKDEKMVIKVALTNKL